MLKPEAIRMASKRVTVIVAGLGLGVAGITGCSVATPAITGGGTTGTPALTISPATLSFASTATGTTATAQTVTLTDSGTANLTISGLTVSGDFQQSATTCGAVLATGASCTVSVTFKPTALGARTGSLNVASTASGGTASVALSGTGAAPIVYTGPGFPVQVLAGTNPIMGASLQLYATGVAGNGSNATPLLPVAMATDANGMATLASFNCPSSTQLLYVVALGGAVKGVSTGNSNISLMTAVGPCGSVVAGTKQIVNEATTVAAAYALQAFYGRSGVSGMIGATATNTTGLTNAFATAATLANTSTGTSPGATLPANASSPAALVNSIANALNACVTNGATCSSLYAATPANSGQPFNTLDAAFDLAQNPAGNVPALYAVSMLSTAFSPALTAAPTDWTMFVNYGGGGLNSPSGIGVDSMGNVWVASYFNAASKFTPAGAPIFSNGVTSGGLNNSYGLALDLNDNAWIPNEQPFTASGIGSVSVITPMGTSQAGQNGYTAGGLNYPISVAIDPNGTTWVVDYGNSHVTLLNQLGTPISGTTGYTTPLFAFPVAVAVDANHNGWIANQSSNTVTKVTPDGVNFTNYDCCMGASGLAIDQGNNVWVANFYGDSVSLISNAGAVVSKGYTGLGSVYRPQGIAVDGAGRVWVANYRAPYLTELAGSAESKPGAAISPKAGLGADSGLLEAYAIALDASGNIWVSNQGSNTITKFIGMATPVKTPLSILPKLP